MPKLISFIKRYSPFLTQDFFFCNREQQQQKKTIDLSISKTCFIVQMLTRLTVHRVKRNRQFQY